MDKATAKNEAVKLAKNKGFSTAVICLIGGEWIPAAHFEGRYLTGYAPMDEAEQMETCNAYEEPHKWEIEPTGLGGMLKDLLSAL